MKRFARKSKQDIVAAQFTVTGSALQQEGIASGVLAMQQAQVIGTCDIA